MIVPIIGDIVDEPNETFTVTLSDVTQATFGVVQDTGTILDDDTPVFPGAKPSLSIDDASVLEGNVGTTNATFTVRLSTPSTETVVAQTAGGSAAAGSDFAALGPVTLTFLPGTTSQILSVQILGDTTVEADETFAVSLSAPDRATIADGQAVGTIRNDDGMTPSPPQPSPSPQPEVLPPDPNNDDEKPKETEEQRQQRERTNRSNRDDEHTEGNVVEVHPEEQPPYVVIANRDGLVKVVLYKDAAKVADSIRVGDYLEVDGEKIHEQLFEATNARIDRAGR